MELDTKLFLREFVRQPRQIAAIGPSSKELADVMVSHIPVDARRIVELGAGTGVFTRAILDSGIRPETLDVFELHPGFADLLRSRHPGLRVHCRRAEEIADLGLPNADAVVSCLPMLSMSEPRQRAILAGAFGLLQASAPFIQFTYGWTVPVRPRLLAEL